MTFFNNASPLIVNLSGSVHFPMTIPYNLFIFSLKISSWSMYLYTRVSHIFILIFYSSSFFVRSSGMWLVSKFVTGSFRSVIILTISSAFLMFFRTYFFRTFFNLSNVTHWFNILVINTWTTFSSGVSPLKSFCSDQLDAPSFPRLKFPCMLHLRVFLISLFVIAGFVGSGFDVTTV